MRWALILLLFLTFGAGATAQEIVSDLSQNEVELTPSFSGQNLFLYGAVKNARDFSTGRFEIIVVIEGEHRPHLVRKKERVFGLWLNTKSETFEDAPEFYAQASTRPLLEITDEATLKNLKLGIDEQLFVQNAGSGEGHGFAEGLIRYKTDENLYQVSVGAISVNADILFRADFFFPAKVPSGSYIAKAYLFHGGELMGWTEKIIVVEQMGLARGLYNLAHNHPAIYGIMAIMMALLAGYFAGWVTGRRQKIA